MFKRARYSLRKNLMGPGPVAGMRAEYIARRSIATRHSEMIRSWGSFYTVDNADHDQIVFATFLNAHGCTDKKEVTVPIAPSQINHSAKTRDRP